MLYELLVNHIYVWHVNNVFSDKAPSFMDITKAHGVIALDFLENLRVVKEIRIVHYKTAMLAYVFG